MLPLSSYFPHNVSFSSLFSASMAVSCFSLIAAMDDLWFRQIILLPEAISAVSLKPDLQSFHLAERSDHSGDNSVSIHSFTSSITSQDDPGNESDEKKSLGTKEEETAIPERSSLKSIYSQSNSSFPPKHKSRKSLTYPIDNSQRLQISLNCRILRDLEQLELKGFMDLGFEFEKGRLSPQTMNMIPGLKRLGKQTTINVSENQAISTLLNGHEYGVGEDERSLPNVGPYLSDAWLVKKPNSPLLRLRMSRVSTARDMKECLKLWARTVVSSVISVQ